MLKPPKEKGSLAGAAAGAAGAGVLKPPKPKGSLAGAAAGAAGAGAGAATGLTGVVGEGTEYPKPKMSLLMPPLLLE